MVKQPRRGNAPSLTKEAVLAHLAEHPGDGKREIARALGVKGHDRQVLKQILADLKDEGAIEQGRKRSFAPAGALPEVAVLEIFGEDPDGEPLGRPADEGYIPQGRLVAQIEAKTSAARAVDMLLAKLKGEPFTSEVQLPVFRPIPAPQPIADLPQNPGAAIGASDPGTGSGVPISSQIGRAHV